MNITQNSTIFYQLREKFSFLRYEKFEIKLVEEVIHIDFHFNLSDQYFFQPTVEISLKDFPALVNLNNPVIHNLAFHMGLIELISYWKTACPARIIIEPAALTDPQIQFFKKVWYHGLGEFFYLNGIEISMNDFVSVECNSKKSFEKDSVLTLKEQVLVPVGGGKDSAVSLEILKKSEKNIFPFAVNPRKAIKDTIAAAGFEKMITVKRTLDPLLLKMNAEGFLNGHTPFSALLAFYTSMIAAMSGIRNIALSNESSANEPTVKGTEINHQYSKSFAFEKDFREYINTWICSDINYFSFLRPLSELQIAYLFSKYEKHHSVFRSCNAGSKTDSWCGNCPKCLFTFIMLHAFMNPEKVSAIWGENLFMKPSMKKYFDELSGASDVKPFECVGTVDEVNLALCEAMKFYTDDSLPLLLKEYKESSLYNKFKSFSLNTEMGSFNNEHFLSDEFLNLLKKEYNAAFNR